MLAGTTLRYILSSQQGGVIMQILRNKYWVLLFLAVAALLLASCGKNNASSSSQNDGGENAPVPSFIAGEEPAAPAQPDIVISLYDGQEVPYTTGEDYPESIVAEGDSVVTVRFLQSMPNAVSVVLTPFYSGGSAWTLDPVDVEIERAGEYQYQLRLPDESTYTPSIFYFLQYCITAEYDDVICNYYFTIQLSRISDHELAVNQFMNGIGATLQEADR